MIYFKVERSVEDLAFGEELLACGIVAGDGEALDVADGGGDAELDVAVCGHGDARRAGGLHLEVHLAAVGHPAVAHDAAHVAAGRRGALHGPGHGVVHAVNRHGRCRCGALHDDLQVVHGDACTGAVGQREVQAGGEVVEVEGAAIGRGLLGHGEDDAVAAVAEVHGEALDGDGGAGGAMVLHGDVVAAAVHGGWVDGVHGLSQWLHLEGEAAVSIGGDGVGRAVEVDAFAGHPGGAVHIGGVHPHLGAAAHAVGKKADAVGRGVVLVAARGQCQQGR